MNTIELTLTSQQLELLRLCLDKGRRAVNETSQGQINDFLEDLFFTTQMVLDDAQQTLPRKGSFNG